MARTSEIRNQEESQEGEWERGRSHCEVPEDIPSKIVDKS